MSKLSNAKPPVVSRTIRFSPWVNALTLGLLAGLGLAAATLFLVVRDGEDAGPHLGLLGQVFYGYTVTFTGALVGFVWGLVVGGIVGYAGSILYNAIASLGAARS